jgi:hypothetical protein
MPGLLCVWRIPHTYKEFGSAPGRIRTSDSRFRKPDRSVCRSSLGLEIRLPKPFCVRRCSPRLIGSTVESLYNHCVLSRRYEDLPHSLNSFRRGRWLVQWSPGHTTQLIEYTRRIPNTLFLSSCTSFGDMSIFPSTLSIFLRVGITVPTNSILYPSSLTRSCLFTDLCGGC